MKHFLSLQKTWKYVVKVTEPPIFFTSILIIFYAFPLNVEGGA